MSAVHKDLIGQTEFTFRRAESEELLKEVYRLRYQVYCKECGFIKPEDCSDSQETDKYDRYSIHFVAEDPQGVVGTTRLILDNPYGFPFEKHCKGKLDFDITGIMRASLAEISRLAISKSYRKRSNDGLYYGQDHADDQKKSDMAMIKRIKPMAFGIYRAIYQECKRRGITYWFALMEKSLWLLLRIHNFVFQPIGEEIDLYGAVRPYVCDINELEKNVYNKAPQFLDYFLDGLESEHRPLIPPK